MRTDNRIVNMMNAAKDILLLLIFSTVVWRNQSNITEFSKSITDDNLLSISLSIGLIIVILVVFLLIRLLLHKLIFSIFNHEK